MIQFLHPEWFFLAPLLIIIGWKAPYLRLHSPLRLLILLGLILALTHPSLKLKGGAMDIWLLVDQSDSMNDKANLASEEIQGILEQSKKRQDRVYIVDFAKEAIRRDKGDRVFRSTTTSTRMGGAIDYILAQIDKSHTTRILAVTDGFTTEPMKEATQKLINAGVKLDFRPITQGAKLDTYISDVKTPTRVYPGENFIVEFTVTGDTGKDSKVPWTITKQNQPPLSGTVELRKGKGTVRITDRIMQPQAVCYNISIQPQEDTILQNNKSKVWIEAAGGSRVLLISLYPNDPIAGYLHAQGIPVSLISSPTTLTPEMLAGSKLVIFNNVHASEIPQEFLKAIPYFVEEQGGALLMCGGKNSFGSGAYFNSPIDPILPVSMELKKDNNKLQVAIAFILDRSGSMAVSVAGGRTKMDMADAGTATAISMLGDRDMVSVHAVDSSPHSIVRMTRLEGQRPAIDTAVRRIESMGGGIFVYEGLKAGYQQLKKVNLGTKHLILFSDACDSEEPGDYITLLEDMKKDGITVSVIAMGKNTDPDAMLLEDIAKLGGGRIYYNEDTHDLPNIFAQETVSIARSAFLTDPVGVKSTAGWAQITAKKLNWLPSVEGYNLSYLREGATAACFSADEYKAPLVSFWSRGSGKSAAILFPTAGDYSQSSRAWKDLGNCIQTLCRWMIGSEAPDGYALKPSLNGERLDVELLYSDSRIPDISKTAPTTSLEITTSGKRNIVQGTWEKIAPGQFRCSYILEDGEQVRGVTKIGDTIIPFGPISIPSDVEWRKDVASKAEFLDAVKRSGGKEISELSSIWDIPRDVKMIDIQDIILWSLLALCLIEALHARIRKGQI